MSRVKQVIQPKHQLKICVSKRGIAGLGSFRHALVRRSSGETRPAIFRAARNSSSTLCISSRVAGSGNVGPLASAHSFPAGTSLTAKVTFVAGPAAAASLPPFTAEKCLRTAFIASIGAPQLTNARCTCCISAKCKLAIERQLHQRRAAPRQKKKHQRPLITLRQHLQNGFARLPALLIRDRVPRDKIAHPVLSICWNRRSGNHARREKRPAASISSARPPWHARPFQSPPHIFCEIDKHRWWRRRSAVTFPPQPIFAAWSGEYRWPPVSGEKSGGPVASIPPSKNYRPLRRFSQLRDSKYSRGACRQKNRARFQLRCTPFLFWSPATPRRYAASAPHSARFKPGWMNGSFS